MNEAETFRWMVKDTREFLEATLAEVSPEQALWQPDGPPSSIAGQYAHVVVAQDMGLQPFLEGWTPLIASEWLGRAGISEPPVPLGAPWGEWAAQQFDFAALRLYAQAVYAASDDCFRSLDDSVMERSVDLTAAGFGVQSTRFLLFNGWVTNVSLHTGEIACIKGLMQRRGYPV